LATAPSAGSFFGKEEAAMKVLTLLALFSSLSAQAAWDSVAVIVRPEKALVQINEPGSRGRLRSFITAFSEAGGFLLTSKDASLKLECGTNDAAASCVIRFLLGSGVVLKPKLVHGSFFAEDLGLDRELGDLDLAFLNSNGDQFAIRTHGAQLELIGSKR
jgi:hypothetical protein